MLPRPHPSVVIQDVADGAVLLHMETEIYFGLNTVGARIWRLLPPECEQLDALCERLAETYPGADPDTLRRDVADLLNELQANDLVLEGESV